MFYYILIYFLILIIFLIRQTTVKPKKFPPGPKWLPYFGSSTQLDWYTKKYGSLFKAFLQLSKDYNTDVLGLKLGSEQLVVFFGEKNIKAVLGAEEFLGRPDTFFTTMRCFGKRAGIFMVDGPLWKIHRKFTMTHFRNAGFGKGTMERDIQENITNLVQWIHKQGDQPMWPREFLPLNVLNIVWKCATGETIKPEKYCYLLELLGKWGNFFNMAGGLLNRASWLRFLMPEYTGYKILVEVNKLILTIIEEAVLKHKNKEVDGHDFIYAFLEEMAKNRETFDDHQLVVILVDIIIAGHASTMYTLEFVILQLLIDQDKQAKVQKEIDQVLGKDMACWADTTRLPYTMAFLTEVQRAHTVAPLLGPRRALKDTAVNGYIIPKDSTVICSVGDVSKDPALWKDPEVFRPERFLDDEGSFVQSEHLSPFGFGYRRCPGEQVSRMFIFITTVTMMQNFTITCADDVLPSTEPHIAMFSSSKKYRALFAPRETEKNK